MARPTIRAVRLSADELEDRTQRAATSKSLAEQMIIDAQDRATQIIETAERVKTEGEDRLRALSEEGFERFVAADRIEKHAASFLALNGQIQQIRDDHEALTPWLVELVSTCVERLLGQIDRPQLIASLVSKGLAELGETHRLTLNIAPGMVPHLAEARLLWPATFENIDEVKEDGTLERDAVVLHCVSGRVDVSVPAQLTTILEQITAADDGLDFVEALPE